LHTNFSQGSVETRLRYGGIFYILLSIYYKFTAKSISKRVLKIGHRLAKLEEKYSGTFSRHSVLTMIEENFIVNSLRQLKIELFYSLCIGNCLLQCSITLGWETEKAAIWFETCTVYPQTKDSLSPT